MESWQEIQLQSLLSVESEAGLLAALLLASNDLGFEYCAYGIRMPIPISNPKVTLLSNYSKLWQQRYIQENYLAVDPTVAHGTRSVMPLLWTENVFATSRPFWEDARAHGLRVGWAQSCHGAQGVGGLLTLARSHDDLSRTELDEHSLKMGWLAQVTHEAMARLVVPALMPEAAVDLSAREIEVLRWSAEGKTSGDVGEIIHITERTVNFHVNNASIKLGASNKTAAAIKAAMLGLL